MAAAQVHAELASFHEQTQICMNRESNFSRLDNRLDEQLLNKQQGKRWTREGLVQLRELLLALECHCL